MKKIVFTLVYIMWNFMIYISLGFVNNEYNINNFNTPQRWWIVFGCWTWLIIAFIFTRVYKDAKDKKETIGYSK